MNVALGYESRGKFMPIHIETADAVFRQKKGNSGVWEVLVKEFLMVFPKNVEQREWTHAAIEIPGGWASTRQCYGSDAGIALPFAPFIVTISCTLP